MSDLIRPTLESSFAAIAPGKTEAAAGAIPRLRERFNEPHRAYHNEAHTLDVLSRLFVWSGGEPPISLVIAALYHDAIYDPTQKDNELRSAEMCREEMAAFRISPEAVHEATRLILLTTRHRPEATDRDGITLCDADLYILGAPTETYAAYGRAIRAEYAHVPEDAWRIGREHVLERFLERPRVFQGDWDGVAEQEVRARRNLSAEIVLLTCAE